MNSYAVTILPGGRITIPAEVRKHLGLQPGDWMVWWHEGTELHLRKARTDEVRHRDHPTAGEAPSADDIDRTHAEE